MRTRKTAVSRSAYALVLHLPPSSLENPQIRLPLARYQCELRALDRVELPRYSGSAWRGAFGHALKGAVCVTRLPRCEDCLLVSSCLYPYMFDTPPPRDTQKMRLYNAAPHPFVLAPEARETHSLAVGERTTLGLTIFGRAHQHLAYFIHALRGAAEQGIGRGRGALVLETVRREPPASQSQWIPVYRAGGGLDIQPPQSVDVPTRPEIAEIELHTPLRVKRDNRNVTPEAFRFADLFVSLMRRVSMLSYFHTDTPLETDFKGLAEQARAVALTHQELRWQEWTRYSSRQRNSMQLGGLVGRIRFEAGNLDALWPYLWLGQWTHAGKAASMGLGRYTISPASLPHRTDCVTE